MFKIVKSQERYVSLVTERLGVGGGGGVLNVGLGRNGCKVHPVKHVVIEPIENTSYS